MPEPSPKPARTLAQSMNPSITTLPLRFEGCVQVLTDLSPLPPTHVLLDLARTQVLARVSAQIGDIQPAARVLDLFPDHLQPCALRQTVREPRGTWVIPSTAPVDVQQQRRWQRAVSTGATTLGCSEWVLQNPL